MSLKETYNKIAESWHQDHQSDDWWVEGTNTFISFLKKGELVLDVGCGAGTKSKYLLKNGLQVIGIDFSEKMIEIARKEIPQGKFFVMDINDVDKLRENFDGIFMQAVLLHVPKKEVESVLKKAVVKLKVGGYLYIAVKEKISINKVMEKLSLDVLEHVLSALNKKQIEKHNIQDILLDVVKGKSVEEAIKIEKTSLHEIEEFVIKLVKEKPGLSVGGYMGLIMARFKGKISGKEAGEIVGKYVK